MVTFDEQPLFQSGTARFQIGPIALRHTVQNTPGSLGAQIDAQGIQARQINQSGELFANNPAMLQSQVDSIRQKLDGMPYVLVDDLGRIWTGTVMVEMDAETFTRVGARWKTTYKIEYLQVIP